MANNFYYWWEDETPTKCDICGKEHRKYDTFKTADGKTVCCECLNEYYFRCWGCGELHLKTEMCECNSYHYCENCFDSWTTICPICGERVNNYDFDNNFGCCNNCKPKPIIGRYHSHNWEKVGKANAKRNIWFKGCELEIDSDGEPSNEMTANELNTAINNGTNHIYFEYDGSLNNGFEIITQPHTFKEFYSINWKRLMDICIENGYTSHEARTCGLHIHYSREFFGNTEDVQAYNIGKLIAFYERNFEALLKFSRRTRSQYEDWAERYYTSNDFKECTRKGKVGRYEENRYHAINLTNSATIEFRLGRGTLNFESFMAWNDFHDTIVRNVKKATYNDIDNMSVWLKGLKPSTAEYMRSRNCNLI